MLEKRRVGSLNLDRFRSCSRSVERRKDIRGATERRSTGRGVPGTRPGPGVVVAMRTVTGERQMAVYLPGQKVLYSSDAFQRGRSGEFFLPQTLSELVDVAHREKLEIVTDVGMHIGPTPWKEIEEAISGFRTLAQEYSGALDQVRSKQRCAY